MPTANNGLFSITISPDDLGRGLRPSKRSPRNVKFLTKCRGAVGRDGILQTVDDLELDRIDTAVITDGFPYPQIFVFTNLIVVCGKTRIYEYSGGALNLKITVAAGLTWTAVDFFEYVYMSNGKVAVVRRATDKGWELSTLPIANAIVNYNNQVMIGSPGVEQI